MPLFRNTYDCPCGTHWDDDWDCMCDDRCPSCDTSCSPTSSVELMGESPVLTFQKDLAAIEAMMNKIWETYGHSQKSNQGIITGRMSSQIPNMYDVEKPTRAADSMKSMRGVSKDRLFHELYGRKGKLFNVVIDDVINGMVSVSPIRWPEENLPYDPMDFYEDGDRLVYGIFRWPSTEKDWERTRFVAGGETPPDAKKRAQLKAKRKKR